jgi:inner membrane protein
MTARTHDAFAFASLVTVASFFPPDKLNLMTLFSSIIAADIGAMIPDMDQAGNRLWDLLPAGDTLGKIFRRVFYKHRTLSHSLLGLFIIYKALAWLLPKFLNASFIDPTIVLYSIMIGYISHLIADSLTKDGLPLLFPFRFEFGIPPISKLRITTGGWIERFIVLPSVASYLIWFIWINQTKLTEIIHLVQ